jgi:hypothetical protein
MATVGVSCPHFENREGWGNRVSFDPSTSKSPVSPEGEEWGTFRFLFSDASDEKDFGEGIRRFA